MPNTHKDTAFSNWIKRLHLLALDNRHRACLVLNGSTEWNGERCRKIVDTLKNFNFLWVSEDLPRDFQNTDLMPRIAPIKPNEARKQLGQEFDGVVFDCCCALSANALGAVSGAIRAGGLLILMTPEFPRWGCQPSEPSRYIRRFKSILESSPYCHCINQEVDFPELNDKSGSTFTATGFKDQERGIAAILKSYNGQRRRPAVLISDRGRGKSAALGIAAKLLFQQGATKIGLTGLNKSSVETVLKHAGCSPNSSRLPYFAAESLADSKVAVDFLLVDEAASISVSTLASLLTQYPRVALASTVHGYEGTGRGFILSFTKMLDQLTRGWKFTQLKEPIRWAENDPVEQLIFALLMLDAEPSANAEQLAQFGHNISQTTIREENPDRIQRDEYRLREVFGLLSLAHYQTRPSDLQFLLDNHHVRLFTASFNGAIVGVALGVIEQPLNTAIANAVWKNQRRPKGNPTAEVLGAQLGIIEALQLTIMRVVRVAVLPELTRNRIGTKLIRHIEQRCRDKADLMATTFSMTADTLAFWNSLDFSPVRIGMNKSANTSNHPGTLIKSLSDDGKVVAEIAENLFRQNLSGHFGQTFHSISPNIAVMIMKWIQPVSEVETLSETEFCNLVRLGFFNGTEDCVSNGLKALALEMICSTPSLERESRSKPRVSSDKPLISDLKIECFLFERILLNKPWRECAVISASEGKQQGLDLLRQCVRDFLNKNYSSRTLQLIQKFDNCG